MSNIIIIDDSKSILMFLSNKIKSEKYSVTTFSNPLKALNDIPKMNPLPDLIITDYMMYDMDGIVLIESLKKLNLNCKFILLTSFRDKDLLNECYAKHICIINKTDIQLLMECIECL